MFLLVSSNLLRHSTRETGKRFSEGLRCPQTPKICMWTLLLGSECSFNLGWCYFMHLRPSVLSPSSSGRPVLLLGSWIETQTLKYCFAIEDMTTTVCAEQKKEESLSITGMFPSPAATTGKQKPSSLLIRCKVSRRIFMVNATTH